MMWKIDAPETDGSQFLGAELLEVLYEFEGPKIFTTVDSGLLRFWYQCAEDDEAGLVRYLVVPANAAVIEKLKDGSRTVHDVLTQPWLWAVETNHSREVRRCWTLGGLQEVPIDAKPRPHVTLWPHLEPLLSYRLIGPSLTEGHIPASVIARATEQPAAPDAMDLMPEDLDAAVYQPGSAKLVHALQWLGSERRTPLELPLLEVLKELAPPAHGAVTSAEITGRLIGPLERFVISRGDRQVIAGAIRHRQQFLKKLVQEDGRIGSFDRDNLTLILRDRTLGSEDLKCQFTEEYFDDLWEAFGSEQRVVLVGMKDAGGRYLRIVALGSIPPDILVATNAPALPNQSDQDSRHSG